MERLIIKNFGPIKDVDIELKKVNIFIGPQGSGKSTIAKIISAVRSYKEWSNEQWLWQDFKTKLVEEFNLASYFENGTELIIETGTGKRIHVDNAKISLSFNSHTAQPSDFLESIYIPTERTIVPLIAESSFLFIRERIPITKYISDFGILFQKARNNVKAQRFYFLDNVMYSFEDNQDKIELKDGKKIMLSESSNGIQSTLPLLLAIELVTSEFYNKSIDKGTSISIEEPELSLFPSAQNELLKFIIDKISSVKNYLLNITTHSPYTLTTINNLIYAYQVGAKDNKVQDIIPNKLWLNPDDVGAWFVENGTARSIIDTELKQIKAEEIDKVSDILNAEYERIMDIKFKKDK